MRHQQLSVGNCSLCLMSMTSATENALHEWRLNDVPRSCFNRRFYSHSVKSELQEFLTISRSLFYSVITAYGGASALQSSAKLFLLLFNMKLYIRLWSSGEKKHLSAVCRLHSYLSYIPPLRSSKKIFFKKDNCILTQFLPSHKLGLFIVVCINRLWPWISGFLPWE